MRKVYLVKKDEDLPGMEGNWITMNAYEFFQFTQTESGKRRWKSFVRVSACGENDELLYVECFPWEAKEKRSENDSEDYLDEIEEDSGYTTMSYYDMGDEHNNGEDHLADETVNVEEAAIRNMINEDVREAVNQLPQREQYVIRALYFTNEKMTESKLAKTMGVKRGTVARIKFRAIRRLREMLENYQ